MRKSSGAETIGEQKARLRRVAQLTRSSLSPDLIVPWSEQAIRRLLRLPIIAKAATVLCYVSVGNEVRTRDLIDELWDRGVTVLVPTKIGDELMPLMITNWNEITVSSIGWCHSNQAVPAYQGPIAINIVPGLAFTTKGDRLGSGAGYYDRFLAAHPKTIRIGLAYELQLVDRLPRESHDQTLDFIVTEDQVMTVNQKTTP